MIHQWYILLAAGAVLLLALFSALWVGARRIDNYSLVDAGWAYFMGCLVLFWALLATGAGLRRVLALGLALAWSLRLGTHLLQRILRNHPVEDSRYAELRQTMGPGAFYVFFQAQALSVLLLGGPFLAMCVNPAPRLGIVEYLGLGVVMIGTLGEWIADAQMARFKARTPNHQQVCREGLWRYSRHPNYFFEFVIWVGFYVAACGSPSGWITFYAPALILFLLLRVTGIPPTERAAVARKGDAYREYQRTTSPLIPWPPRA